MKASRSYLIAIALILGGLCVSNLISLTGYFQSVEGGGNGMMSEKRLLSQLEQFHAQLKATEEPAQAQRLIRSFETGFGGKESEFTESLKKAYAPVLAAFASKPKEAESRFLMVKKRELMEGLVNAYRKEIPNGPIPLRAAYLNILFDTQNSLLNESQETERVYIRRTKERFAAVAGIAASDAGIGFRVGNLESVFQSYEKGFEQGIQWEQQKQDALGRAEKALPKLSREFFGSKDDQMEDVRRSFLYAAIIALVAAVLGFLLLYICHKMLKLRFEHRAESFVRLLKEFGRERQDAGFEKDLATLQEDPDWASLAQGMVDSEAEFLSKYQALLAVPKSVKTPYIVFTKDRVAKHWNEGAEALFSLGDHPGAALDDLLHEGRLEAREGETSLVVEMIRNSFSAPKDDAFEFFLKHDDGRSPYELLSYPIVAGPMAGGKVFLFREIRSESERVERAVSAQLSRVRSIVQKISHEYNVEIVASEADSKEVREALGDIDAMKRKMEEREALWKSEAGALLDQASRQRELMERLSAEMLQVRQAHESALLLVGTIHGEDAHLHEEICMLEKEVEHWHGLRERLEADLGRQGQILARARDYEQEVRTSAEEIGAFLIGYEAVLEELRSFSEQAKVHAVNMGFVKDPAQREAAARSRAFSHEISRFVERAARISEKVKAFLQAHPASALAPHLESRDIDPGLLESLRKEEAQFGAFVKRWKETGEGLVAGGEQAMALLRQADKKSAVASQLGETVLLINEQTKGNLARWN